MGVDRIEIRVNGMRYMIRNRDGMFTVQDSRGMVLVVGQDTNTTFAQWVGEYATGLMEETDE